MYVCMYSLCVCMYTRNACCEASTQTNILLLSLLLGGPNPFGGGGRATKPDTGIIYIYMLYVVIQLGRPSGGDLHLANEGPEALSSSPPWHWPGFYCSHGPAGVMPKASPPSTQRESCGGTWTRRRRSKLKWSRMRSWSRQTPRKWRSSRRE